MHNFIAAFGTILSAGVWNSSPLTVMFALSSARSLLASCRPSTSILGHVQSRIPSLLNPTNTASRASSQLAPRNVKFLKRHKGILPIPIGGSIKGTTLAFGQWGIRPREREALQLASHYSSINRRCLFSERGLLTNSLSCFGVGPLTLSLSLA